MLSILDLFTIERPAMTVDEMAAAIGVPRTTCYRYTRELAGAGLLSSGGGMYRLGHRIVQLDHQLREHDPLIVASLPLLQRLASETGASAMVSGLYGDKIVNIHLESSEPAPQQLLGRGREMPLFRTATSMAILSSLPRTRLMKLQRTHRDEAPNWSTLVRNTGQARRQGYCVSHGELVVGLVGLAAPVLGAPRDMAPAALSLIFDSRHFRRFDEAQLGIELAHCGRTIGTKLSAPATSETRRLTASLT